MITYTVKSRSKPSDTGEEFVATKITVAKWMTQIIPPSWKGNASGYFHARIFTLLAAYKEYVMYLQGPTSRQTFTRLGVFDRQ